MTDTGMEMVAVPGLGNGLRSPANGPDIESVDPVVATSPTLRELAEHQPSLNGEVDWSAFDSEAYFAHNYRTLRDDDREIMKIVRDWFVTAAIGPEAVGVDVGTGTNLYPALAMLPFCSRLELRELSPPNVAWLKKQIASFGA